MGSIEAFMGKDSAVGRRVDVTCSPEIFTGMLASGVDSIDYGCLARTTTSINFPFGDRGPCSSHQPNKPLYPKVVSEGRTILFI